MNYSTYDRYRRLLLNEVKAIEYKNRDGFSLPLHENNVKKPIIRYGVTLFLMPYVFRGLYRKI